MGLLETEINELRQLRMDVRGGKISTEKAVVEIGIYNQVQARAKMIIQVMRMGSESPKSLNRLIKKNLIGEGSAIQVDVDYVKCQKQDKIITRDECLDHSEKTQNNAECSLCENFSATRNILLGEKQ